MKREKDNPGRGKVKLKVGVEHVLKFKRVSKLCEVFGSRHSFNPNRFSVKGNPLLVQFLERFVGFLKLRSFPAAKPAAERFHANSGTKILIFPDARQTKLRFSSVT